jgi:hypothetical protein
MRLVSLRLAGRGLSVNSDARRKCGRFVDVVVKYKSQVETSLGFC